MPETFQHEHLATVPRGYKVRTVTRGDHEIRVAFPPGRRRRGTGVPVEILHPRGENPLCKIVNLINPSTLDLKRATRERARRIREARGNPSPEAHELYLWITSGPNKERLYRQQGHPIELNLAKKYQKGKYDHARAPKLWKYFADTAAKDYCKEHGCTKAAVFPKPVLEEVAQRLADEYFSQLRAHGGVLRDNPRKFQLDEFEKQHLAKWLANKFVNHRDKLEARKAIMVALAQEPTLIQEGKSWDEIARIGFAIQGNPFDWREQRELGGSGSLFDSIRHGDRVTFVDRFGKSRTGRAVMRGPSGWVLNMGGAHGTPQVVHEDMVTRVRSNPSPKETPRPRRGESVPEYHARRVREILAKMPKPIRDVFDRNPASYKFVFRNPDDELGQAEGLYEEFHGRAPREILEMQESSEQRGEYTALGDLVELTMIAPTGDHVQVKFKDDGVRVASSPNGEQLYLLGGNQDISGSLATLFGADDGKDLVDLGEAKQIVYEAAKWQTDFTAQEWKHDFGEESGVRPRAFFDQLKKRIFFAGGNYQVKRPGIVD